LIKKTFGENTNKLFLAVRKYQDKRWEIL